MMNDLETTQAERARDAQLISDAVEDLQCEAKQNHSLTWFQIFDSCDPEPLETLAEALRQWMQDRDVRTDPEPF